MYLLHFLLAGQEKASLRINQRRIYPEKIRLVLLGGKKCITYYGIRYGQTIFGFAFQSFFEISGDSGS